MDSPPGPAPVFFDARLHPHRSLSLRGFHRLLGVFAVLSLTVGLICWLRGAWPVIGFCGLDTLALYAAFRVSYRRALSYESVRLTETELVVERVGGAGPPRTWTFQPYWLRVSMDDPPDHESQVVLSSHGRSLVVGSFLPPEQRAEFADALRSALARHRRAGFQPSRS